MDNSNLIRNLLENYLGKGKRLSKGDVAFYCPFCKHHNPKLMVNIKTGDYNCFTCHPPTKGRSPIALLKKIGAPNDALIEMKSYFVNDTFKIINTPEVKTITIPKEFKSILDNMSDLECRHAIAYLKNRGLTLQDIQKYNIGYCKTGRYANKIIIPSYDASGKLNYFIARSFEKEPRLKIDSPECKKSEIVGFEYYINWNVPVILCEGVFDAIAIKRNAIPLFGKTIPKGVMIKLLQSEVKTIYLALDADALMESIDSAQKLIDLGKEVYLIQLQGKDPSDIGFENMIKLLQYATPLSSSELMLLKMKIALC